MSKQDEKGPEIAAPAPPAPPASKDKRKKAPKEEAVQVTVKLTSNLRQKLLELNQEHSETARYDLPLTATVALAIEVAHEAYFGTEPKTGTVN